MRIMKCAASSLEGFVVGFQLRVEPPQGRGDDTAANNIQLMCSTGEVLVAAEGLDYGEWGEWRSGPRGMVVRGIRTQVEDDGDGDTGLNNVDVECEKLQTDCRPSDKWVEVKRCQNDVGTPIKCSHERTVGTSISTTLSTGGSKTQSIETTLGVELGASYKGIIQATFTASTTWSSSTTYNWATAEESLFYSETKSTVTVDVPPGQTYIIEMVTGMCGATIVGTAEWRVKSKSNGSILDSKHTT